MKIDYVRIAYFNSANIDERRENMKLHATTHIEKLREKLDFSVCKNHTKINKVSIADKDIEKMDRS